MWLNQSNLLPNSVVLKVKVVFKSWNVECTIFQTSLADPIVDIRVWEIIFRWNHTFLVYKLCPTIDWASEVWKIVFIVLWFKDDHHLKEWLWIFALRLIICCRFPYIFIRLYYSRGIVHKLVALLNNLRFVCNWAGRLKTCSCG